MPGVVTVQQRLILRQAQAVFVERAGKRRPGKRSVRCVKPYSEF